MGVTVPGQLPASTQQPLVPERTSERVMSVPTLPAVPTSSASSAVPAVSTPAQPEPLPVVGADGHLVAATWHGPTAADATHAGRVSRIIVLAHGLFLSGLAWGQVTAALAEQHLDPELAVVVYDHRGHGGTTCGEAALSLELLARDMAGVIAAARAHAQRINTAIEPGAPALAVHLTVAGHSLGAMTALTLLANEKIHTTAGQIDRAVLASASPGCLAGGGLLRILPKIAKRHPDAFVKAQATFRTAMAPLLGPAAVCPIDPCGLDVTDQISQPPLSGLAAAQLLGALGAYDIRTELAHRATSTELPEFALLCGAGDRITPVAHTRTLAHLLGLDIADDTAVQVLDKISHNLPLEDPAAMAGGCATWAA